MTLVALSQVQVRPGTTDHPVTLPDPVHDRDVILVGAGLSHLAGRLTRAGATVVESADPADARRQAALLGPAAIVVLQTARLDARSLSAVAGLRDQDALVVAVPAATAEQRVELLRLGADHVSVAGGDEEILACLVSVLRRARSRSRRRERVLQVGELCVDIDARLATLRGRTLPLTTLEFDLLAYFMTRPGSAVSRQRLLSDVWGFDIGSLETVTVHVRRLRLKIETDASNPQLLGTVWGIGYRLADPSCR